MIQNIGVVVAQKKPAVLTSDRVSRIKIQKMDVERAGKRLVQKIAPQHTVKDGAVQFCEKEFCVCQYSDRPREIFVCTAVNVVGVSFLYEKWTDRQGAGKQDRKENTEIYFDAVFWGHVETLL